MLTMALDSQDTEEGCDVVPGFKVSWSSARTETSWQTPQFSASADNRANMKCRRAPRMISSPLVVESW